MHFSTLCVGSPGALGEVLADRELFVPRPNLDVVIVPTAAAFTGATQCAIELSEFFAAFDARVEVLMVIDRASGGEAYFAERIASADVVVLGDGSVLHARIVWRQSPVGEAIAHATLLISVGAVSSVLGDVMVDPRGGAPTTGLGYRLGAAICAPASDEQLRRTRALLSDDVALVVLGASGVLGHDGTRWHVVRGEVCVTRGQVLADL